MALKLETPIATARVVLNDPEGVRYLTPDLVRYGNEAIKLLLEAQPTLFLCEGELLCEANAAYQTLVFDDARTLTDIVRIKGGGVILKADKAMFDAFDPTWMAKTPGPAINWLPVGANPLAFYLYPPAPAEQTIVVTYVRTPPEYVATSNTELPPSMGPLIADYIIYRAESADDEHVLSQRATMHREAFFAAIKSGT